MPVEDDEVPCNCGRAKPKGNRYCSFLCYLKVNEPDKVAWWLEVIKKDSRGEYSKKQ